MPNLVLGTAFRYGPEQIHAFVTSLREHYTGDAALLISSMNPPEVVAYLDRHRIQPVFFDCAFWIGGDLQTSRYFRYYDFLRDQRVRFDRILLTDVSDVVFQADPFADLPEGDLLMFLEDRTRTIASCPANKFWTLALFGDKGLAQYGDKPISCSGTTIGTGPAILQYLEHMRHHARPEVFARLLQEGKGYDQGVHNFLLHSGQLSTARAVENGDFVWTLAHVAEDEIATGPNGITRVRDGRKPAIVHQFPYKKAAAAWVAERYRYP